mgnify:CR=1 FL=1
MKRELVEILACPVSKATLTLVVKETSGSEIVTGGLICPTCNHEFDISDDVPNLLPWEQCAEL